MSDASGAIDRREALRRAALLLGGTLAAPAAAGVLAGVLGSCSDWRSDAAAWTPRAFSRTQGELVATIAEHIIPATDTPGARAAGAHRFIDTMLAEYYAGPERAQFLAGLADLDARAERAHGRTFLRSDDAAQRALLTALDAETFAPASSAPSGETPWFRTMKELTLLAYYTSEPGATKELRYEPVPGRYDGCVPLASVGRTWAT